jgi:hypothetical protein
MFVLGKLIICGTNAFFAFFFASMFIGQRRIAKMLKSVTENFMVLFFLFIMKKVLCRKRLSRAVWSDV